MTSYRLNGRKCADCLGLYLRHRHLMTRRKWDRNNYERLKTNAMLTVGKGRLECERCGIEEIEILEINHKYGGGAIDRRSHSSHDTYLRNIIDRKCELDNLNLLCKVCNAIHYVKMRYNIEWRDTINVLE